MMRYIKHIFRRILISQLYRKYVVGNQLVEKDIERTITMKNCTVGSDLLKDQFKHVMLYYPEFAFIFFWRADLPHYRWRYLFTRDFQTKIFMSTKIGGGLICHHPFATVINAKSIGENFQFRNSLTIGNKRNDNSLLPTIGSHVTVGANVVIIGNINIGDHVTIGAGSVVVKDVPSYSVVAGNPAKVIRNLDHE
ncbi:MAG: hypothetical protein GYB32_11820 [Algicola sp.]|nr:hypothetical protein [Algicola sp.]